MLWNKCRPSITTIYFVVSFINVFVAGSNFADCVNVKVWIVVKRRQEINKLCIVLIARTVRTVVDKTLRPYRFTAHRSMTVCSA